MSRPFAAALALAIVLAAGAAFAQAVTSGEALLDRDVEVRLAPDAAAPVAAKLAKGSVVMALGAPRGRPFTEIVAAGGVGYVPSGVLRSIYAPRQATGTVAVVSRARWAPDGVLRGSHVVRRAVSGMALRDGKRVPVKMEPGTVLSLLDVQAGKLRFASDTIASVTLDADALLPVAGVHDYAFGGAAPGLLLARLGEHADPERARAEWSRLSASIPLLARYAPFVFPAVGDPARFTLSFGPLDRRGAEAACTALAQRLVDCWLLDVVAY
ncbi:hypothetical protein [Arenibaculum sp.]|jgi:hypothetical protein|uniref:hypothetical protein n=1 Tax=Arenibaculum sp. TaxID=2865862 RepID=UPI002E156945|nr:hypothetical protein [Arenibaculum sp.]